MEGQVEDRIAVAQQVTRERVKIKAAGRAPAAPVAVAPD